MAGLTSENANVAAYSAQLLGRFRHKPAARPLIERLLRDWHHSLRWCYLEALAQTGLDDCPTEFTAALADKLRHEKRDFTIATVLAHLGDQSALEYLFERLSDTGGGAAAPAAIQLGLLREATVVDRLIGLIDTSHAGVSAAQALGMIGDARASRPLLEGCKGTFGRQQCFEAFLAIGDVRYAEEFLQRLRKDRLGHTQLKVADYLYRSGPRVVPGLIEAAVEPSYHASQYVAALVRLLSDKSEEIDASDLMTLANIKDTIELSAEFPYDDSGGYSELRQRVSCKRIRELARQGMKRRESPESS
jgi:HEAT repeat protein